MSKRWYQEHKKEHYYKSAKKRGYRSRSAYKLAQINKRFSLISQGHAVVDLGAAPGGWSQVSMELVGDSGKVVGIDLDYISPIDGVVFIRGDMLSPLVVNRVISEISTVDVVISDMSPNISGIYTLDQARSFELAMCTLEFAMKVLRNGGRMVSKIFEGEDFNFFLSEAKKKFSYVKPYSPPASRNKSSEIYVVCKGAQMTGMKQNPKGTHRK
ncbi:MAG: RlmE family RNA methyltransferase [Candidatus Thermoplasmatota archaeon]|jgi:23S rRNA (uridine2552-2'-O)-methyltransferase|nr:RlmE family RNA methyltransferase [Candidatus Thermoplasmatota archaeon]MDP7265207.1 RlmE family RNA methyltransferase [Candidatus Thermoplasmatota archaeon]